MILAANFRRRQLIAQVNTAERRQQQVVRADLRGRLFLVSRAAAADSSAMQSVVVFGRPAHLLPACVLIRRAQINCLGGRPRDAAD